MLLQLVKIAEPSLVLHGCIALEVNVKNNILFLLVDNVMMTSNVYQEPTVLRPPQIPLAKLSLTV